MTRCWNNDHHQLRPRQGLLDIHRYGMNLGVTIFPDTGEFDGFSGQSMGKILGKIWVFASHMVGAAVASVFAGVIRDAQGSYFIAWITAAVLCLVATGAILSLRKDAQAQGGFVSLT